MSSQSQNYATLDVVHMGILFCLEDILIDEALMKEKIDKIAAPIATKKDDSQCLMCGRIYYAQAIEKCPKCQGACVVYKNGDLVYCSRTGSNYA